MENEENDLGALLSSIAGNGDLLTSLAKRLSADETDGEKREDEKTRTKDPTLLLRALSPYLSPKRQKLVGEILRFSTLARLLGKEEDRV